MLALVVALALLYARGRSLGVRPFATTYGGPSIAARAAAPLLLRRQGGASRP